MPSEHLQLAFLRGHLKLHVAGMRHSRLSPSRLLCLASAATGKTYKRGQYAIALADIEALLAS